MTKQEWPANEYAIGSYIQATVADRYLDRLQINPDDTVLDIGCGNGIYSQKILEKVPKGKVFGIDASDNMLRRAKEVADHHPNFSTQKADVLSMSFSKQFEYVVSFWCLQWAPDIKKAFTNIFNALKPGGKLLAIFPAGDDPYIMSYYAIKKSGQFKSLDHFQSPVDYSTLNNLAEQLAFIQFRKLNVELHRERIILPSLETFRKFVRGIAFYQGQVPEHEIEAINEAMVQYYEEECQSKYNGEYCFDFTIYFITGEK